MEKYILDKLHYSELKIMDEIHRICIKNNLKYYLIGGSLLGAIRHNGFIPWDDDLDIAMPRKDYDKFIKLCSDQLNDKFYLDSLENNDKYCFGFAKVRMKNTIYEEKYQINQSVPKGIWVDVFPLDDAKDEYNWFQRWQAIVNTYCLKSLSYQTNTTNMSLKSYQKKLIKLISLLPRKKIIEMQKRNTRKCNGKKYNYYINFSSQYGIKKQTHLKKNFDEGILYNFEGKKYYGPKNGKEILKKIYGKNFMDLPPLEKRITHNPSTIIFEDGERVDFNEKI